MRLRMAGYAVALGAVVAIAPGVAKAGPVLFSAASENLAAAVTFDIVAGSRLQVVLTNTSRNDVRVPAEVLTGVYFSGIDALVPETARLSFGSELVYGSVKLDDGIVGGEWGFASGLDTLPNGSTAALMSTGALKGLGHPNFRGENLAGPEGLGGLQFGLLSAGDDAKTGNGGVTGSGGLVRNSVTFLLSGVPDGFSIDRIGNVSFQYGRSLSEPILRAAAPLPGVPVPTVTPEPASSALLGVAMIALGLVRRRRRSRRR